MHDINNRHQVHFRERPFNLKGGLWFFVSFRQHKSYNIIFFCRAKRKFFFPNLTLGYMTKILNHIIFFFLHQHQNIFFSNIGNQNIFLEKNHNPPPPFKLNGRSLSEEIGKPNNKSCCEPNQKIIIVFKQIG